METIIYKHYTITKLDSGTIKTTKYNQPAHITKPVLRELAQELGISLENKYGTVHNTRYLGVLVMRTIKEAYSHEHRVVKE